MPYPADKVIRPLNNWGQDNLKHKEITNTSTNMPRSLVREHKMNVLSRILRFLYPSDEACLCWRIDLTVRESDD